MYKKEDIVQALKWIVWEFFSIRFIWTKISPEEEGKNKKPPSSFFFWFISIYVALFTLTSSMYENQSNLLYNRLALSLTQLTIKNKVGFIPTGSVELIVDLQQKKLPIKPYFLSPPSVLLSLWSSRRDGGKTDDNVRSIIIRAFEDHKENLNEAILEGAFLERANLENASFASANLKNVKFNEANLTKANFDGAYFDDNTELIFANIKESRIVNIKFENTINPEFKDSQVELTEKLVAILLLSCNWEKAKYSGTWNDKTNEWIEDEENNQKVINYLSKKWAKKTQEKQNNHKAKCDELWKNS